MDYIFLTLLWGAFLLCNLFIVPKYAPDIMPWYPAYSLIVSVLTSVIILAF